MYRRNRVVTLILLLTSTWLVGYSASPTDAGSGRWGGEARTLSIQQIYLPLILTPYQYTPSRRVNAPYFTGSVDLAQKYPELAIFWFGQVTQTDNHADVRVGYNDAELYVRVAAFDRRLWYDTTPASSDLTAWDSVTLYLNLSGNSGNLPTPNAYKFDAQLDNCNPTAPNFASCRAPYRASYRGNGSGWGATPISFDTLSGWRGDVALNNNGDDRGWAMTFRIPFTSLGLSSPPSQGSLPWGLAVNLHDRDDSVGTSIPDKTWPEATVDPTRPASWGQLAFGLPSYTPPPASSPQTATIRHKLNGATVMDAAVGGTGSNLCGDGLDFWTQWGQTNHAGDSTFAIQNQSDLADWPCFSKYYVTFPLNAIPSGKVIISATLTLHQMGGSGPASNGDPPAPALIQVLTVAEDWSEATLIWNNAPLALENVSRAWVDNVVGCGAEGGIPWPCIPRTWDVSRAVAQAYATGQPLRLVLYAADSAYSTGKYFTSSDTGDWNETGRPQLDVRWGNP